MPLKRTKGVVWGLVEQSGGVVRTSGAARGAGRWRW